MYWLNVGKGLFKASVLIGTRHVKELFYPLTLTWTTSNLQPRTLTVISAKVELEGQGQELMYEVKPNNI